VVLKVTTLDLDGVDSESNVKSVVVGRVDGEAPSGDAWEGFARPIPRRIWADLVGRTAASKWLRGLTSFEKTASKER
jgi:hypothetical protein